MLIKRLELNFDCLPTGLCVNGVGRRMPQCLENLLQSCSLVENVLYYMPVHMKLFSYSLFYHSEKESG